MNGALILIAGHSVQVSAAPDGDYFATMRKLSQSTIVTINLCTFTRILHIHRGTLPESTTENENSGLATQPEAVSRSETRIVPMATMETLLHGKGWVA